MIISSPYKRAIQTVKGVANFIGKEVIIEDGFKERTLSVKPVKYFNMTDNYFIKYGESFNVYSIENLNDLNSDIIISTENRKSQVVKEYNEKFTNRRFKCLLLAEM
nr:histidine phosphatase family protein [Terrihalobacillus insolitus]